MGQSYALNKVHIYNYRVNNKEKFDKYHRINQKKYDEWKRIARVFRNILF